jgi:hypothetical protein
MDLDKYQALKMKTAIVGSTEYLFIEAGGFSNRHKPDWKTKWHVFTR